MSVRKARQLLAFQQKKQQPEVTVPLQEEEQLPKSRKVNMFSAFNQSESSEQQKNQEPKAEIKEQVKKESQQKLDTKQIKQQQVQTKTKKTKKNRKKKHHKEGQHQQDIEKILEQQFGKREPEEEEKDDKPHYDLLEINENKFNYQKELSKYFKDTKQEADLDPQGMKKRDKKYMKALARQLKKSTLAPGMKQFFPLTEKFQVETKDHAVTFEVSKKSEVLQEQYEAIKNSNDIQQMFDFLQRHPDSVDALYNVGQFLRLKGDYKQADALIQRIIYIYEQSCLYEIGLLLKQNHPKNKFVYNRNSSAFFMSLFKFIDILGKKGCYRSALQYNKLLLKLNTSDPTACLLCFDYNACSAKQYEYLLQFVTYFAQQFNNNKQKQTIYWLPNMMYSAALASFELAQQVKSSSKVIEQSNIQAQLIFTEEHLKKALDLANFNVQKQPSQVLILRALILYPRIMKDIAAKNDYSKQMLGHSSLKGSQKLPYKDILGHEFFNFAAENYFYSFLELETEADSKGMLKALETYPTRSRILWKANNVMLWIKAAAGFLLDNLQGLQYPKLVESLCLKENNKNTPSIAFRLSRYENVSKANFTDHVQRVDLQNIQDNQAPRPAEANPINLGNHPLRLFLESLLPWRHLPNAQQDPNMPQIEQHFD